MHCGVSNYEESTRENSQANNVGPIGANVETKCTEYGSTRDFNVKSVLMVDQCKVLNLIHDEALKSVVKYGKLQEVSSNLKNRLKVLLTA